MRVHLPGAQTQPPWPQGAILIRREGQEAFLLADASAGCTEAALRERFGADVDVHGLTLEDLFVERTRAIHIGILSTVYALLALYFLAQIPLLVLKFLSPQESCAANLLVTSVIWT